MIFSSLILTLVLVTIHLAFASSSEEAGIPMVTREAEDGNKKRGLTWGPWRPACKDRFQDLTKALYLDSCYDYCNGLDYDDPNNEHGYAAKWQCKGACRVNKREKFQECVSAHCSEDPAAAPAPYIYTPEENDLCSKCPCCADDSEFKEAVLRPTLCNYDEFEFCDSTNSFCEYGDAYNAWTCNGESASISSTNFFGLFYSQLVCRSGGLRIELQPPCTDGEEPDPVGREEYDACKALFDRSKCSTCAPREVNDAYCESLAG
uniref:Uncharacterized protein n=1 Tax=Grammatophora oceanica TaxID=210454 RepID=A0A7S1VJH6_9STRA|mmetsp:Transcript_47984/g.71470  ORF Transcript_47984/g.71470 Transcript_47984/m.71470 type:complete len:262 (+) Transcript_47984:124-909(+)